MSDMKDMFEDMVERLLGDMVTPDLITAAERDTWPEALWSAIEENGLTLAAVPEDKGGVGGSWHDAYALVRAAGRHAAPVPLAETILVNWLVGLGGGEAVAGPATVAAGTFEGGRVTLEGVPWGSHAGHVLVAAGGNQAVLLACADAKSTDELDIAREPRSTLVFEGATPVATLTLPSDAAELIRLGGASIRAGQIAGGLQRILSTAIDYANDRVQFGRPIGKFQAIQHQIAVLAENVSMANAAAETAFATADAAGPKPLAVAAAKAVASEAAGQGAAIAHAVLGAIGFTYEHSLHLTTRRLWSWRSEFGSQADWSKSLGAAACRAGGDALWPAIVAGQFAA